MASGNEFPVSEGWRLAVLNDAVARQFPDPLQDGRSPSRSWTGQDQFEVRIHAYQVLDSVGERLRVLVVLPAMVPQNPRGASLPGGRTDPGEVDAYGQYVAT